MSDMQKEFEEWFLHNYSWHIEKSRNGYHLDKYEDEPNQYISEKAHHDWRVWQASRASLCVTLPTQKKPKGDNDQIMVTICVNSGIEQCKEAITKTGVRVK